MRALNVKPCNDRNEWESVVREANPSTFLHGYAWGDFEASMGRPIVRLGVYEGDTCIAVCLAVKIGARRGIHLLVPHGPIIKAGIPAQDVIEVLTKELKAIALRQGCAWIRISTVLLDNEEHRSVFKHCGYRNAPIHVHTELSWLLDITKDDEVLLSEMKKNTRYGVRKGEKDGIEIWSSASPADIDLFWTVYTTTAERNKFVPYSRKFIEKEFMALAPAGQAKLYFAKYQGDIVSTAFITYTDTMAFYHHGASLQAHGSITPSEYLHWRIITDAKARGIKTYNFWGVVSDEEIHHPWFGLSKFKKGFGGYPEKYIHAQDLVLSWRYWPAYIIEKIRKWKRNV